MGRGMRAKPKKQKSNTFNIDTRQNYKLKESMLIQTHSVMNMDITLSVLSTHFEFTPAQLDEFIKYYRINVASLADGDITLNDLHENVLEETGIDSYAIPEWGEDDYE